MSEDIKEQLSALMDGELSRDERAFLLRRLDHDAELRALWSRMHMARDVIAHRPAVTPLNIADSVMAAIAEDSKVAEIKPTRAKAWRPWLGAAIAASVAMVAVLSIGPRGLQDAERFSEQAPAPRVALPAGVPGPIAPSLNGLGLGVQTVSAETSRVLSGPGAISADQLMLLRHGQISEGTWMVGGAAHAYDVSKEIAPVEAGLERGR